MQAEEKYNQIASWFNTPEPEPEPEPEPPTPTPLKTVGDFIARSFMIAFVISGIFFGIGIITNIIGSIWSFLSSNRWDIDDAIPTLITLAIIAFILTNIIYAISDARDNAKKKAENARDNAKKKAEYDKTKAKYDEAKAKYDALPSVSQMEQWLEEDLENLKKGALQKTGLDEESEIVGEHPVITRVSSSEWSPMSTKATEHKHYLFPIWHLTILYTSDRSIVVYKCEYDWLNNRLLSDSTTEYFYKDIVAVERRSMGFDEIINISMSNGSSVGIALNGQGSTELSNRVDKAAQGIRRLLKDSKEDSEDSK